MAARQLVRGLLRSILKQAEGDSHQCQARPFQRSLFFCLGLLQPSFPPPKSTTTTETLSSVRRCSATLVSLSAMSCALRLLEVTPGHCHCIVAGHHIPAHEKTHA